MSASGPAPRRITLVALILFLGTVLLFSRSLGYDFIDYDDPRYILNNTAIHGGFDAESLRWVVAGQTDIWNPLVRLSQVLDIQLFGLNATGHHLHSILWHALNAVLSFLLLRRLTGAFWTSALCAALFAWHPLRVESVTWISERKDVMSVAFGLLTLLAYTTYAARRRAGAVARGPYALTLLAFAGALLCKPSMVTLPGVLFLLDYWPLRRWAFAPAGEAPAAPEGMTRLLAEKLPFLLLAAISAYLTVHTQTEAGDFVLDLSLGARLANALVSLPRYLGKFFWPFNLSIAYHHPGWWPWPVVAGAAAVVATLSWLAWSRRKTQPWILVGGLWFVGALLPMIGIVQVGFQSIADRYTYFPLLGWQLALIWTLRAALPGGLPRGLLPTVVTCVLVGCAALTWHQQGYWRDPVALSQQAVDATENDPFGHAFLANSLASAGRNAEARREAELALALDPHNNIALASMARLEAFEDHPAAAVAHYQTLRTLLPNNSGLALEMAEYLHLVQKTDEAREIYLSLRSHPRVGGQARSALALLALEQGDRPAALDLLRAAYADYPDGAVLGNLTGLLHLMQQDTEAESLLAAALKRQPDSPEVLRAYAAFLRGTKRPHEAIPLLDRAIARRPFEPLLRHERARALVEQGRIAEAIQANADILARFPKYAPAAFDAGILEEGRGNATEALARYRQAVVANPAHVSAQVALAHLTEAKGDTSAADAIFAAAMEAAPYAPELPRTYADTLARRHQFDAALTYYRRALALAPQDAGTHAGCGYTLFLLGRPAEALVQFEETLRLKPDFPRIREICARLRAAGP